MDVSDILLMGYAPMGAAIAYLYIRTNKLQDDRVEELRTVLKTLEESKTVQKSLIEVVREALRKND